MDPKICAIFDLGYFRNAIMGTIIESMYRAGYKYKDVIEVTYHTFDVLDELNAETLCKIETEFLCQKYKKSIYK